MQRPVGHFPLRCSLAAILGLAAASTANADLIFNVRTDGTLTQSGAPPLIHVDVNHAVTSSTPFPLSTAVLSQDVNVSAVPLVILNGLLTFTAPSGERIFATYTGTAFPTPTGVTYSGPFQFAGGTGQFLGVTGGGTYSGEAVFTSATTGNSFVIWTGAIAPVPAPSSLAMLMSGAIPVVALLRRAVIRSNRMGGSP